jgi:hypothetical protein
MIMSMISVSSLFDNRPDYTPAPDQPVCHVIDS